MRLIAPFGILESARTGMHHSYTTGTLSRWPTVTNGLLIVGLMALPRSPLHPNIEELDGKDAGDLVDASSLPPG